MPTPSFNWITFLLGFAIALWIAIVALFIIPEELEPDPPPAACHVTGCNQWRVGIPRLAHRTLWIRQGDNPEFCTNNDLGGGYIEDIGGGYVDDIGGGYIDDIGGGYIDDIGGGYIDDIGGGYVDYSWPRVPAPRSDQLERPRNPEEFQCRSNDNGGGYIEDSTRRSVVMPMPNDDRFGCWVDPGKNASVLRKEGPPGDESYVRVRFDKHQNVVLLDDITTDDAETAAWAGPPATGVNDDWLFCMVPLAGQVPNFTSAIGQKANEHRILTKNGICVLNCP